MNLTFRQQENALTLQDLNDFETLIGLVLPQDYKEHMIAHNGGIVNESVGHTNYPEGGEGISKFYPIKYGTYKIEEISSNLKGKIPKGYLIIGITNNAAKIIMSLNNDSTYGNIKEYFPDGEMLDLSTSFTELLNNMIELDEE